MNRRLFLIRGAGAVGGTLLAGGLLARGRDPAWAQEVAPPAAMPPDATPLDSTPLDSTPPESASADTPPGVAAPDLVVARGTPQAAVSFALETLGGLQRFLPAGGAVLIKPNASFPTPPEWGATTHPEVLAALIAACVAAGARRVIVADHTMGNAERCFQRTGTAEAVARFPEAKLLSLDDPQMYREVEVPRGQSLHTVAIPLVLERVDLFINLPTAKAHNATQAGLGLKNLMGLVHDRNTFHNDMDIHVGIADLATVLRPQLTILDAMYVLTTNGPAGPGEVHPLGLVVAGADPVAVDAYGVRLGTWNGQTLEPAQVAYIRHAAERGVGTLDLSALAIAERSA